MSELHARKTPVADLTASQPVSGSGCHPNIPSPQEAIFTFNEIEVTGDLNAITNLYADLHAEAEHKAHDPLMPGGLAMVALGYVANQEAWERQIETAETRGNASHILDEDDTWEPPLQTLCFWSERWRAIHGAEYDRRPTIATEANYIRWALRWAVANEPHLDDLAKDIHKARTRMENVLRDGTRDVISEDVTCLICETRLRRRMTITGYEDEWWCIDCHHHLTAAQFNLAASESARRQLADQYPDLGIA